MRKRETLSAEQLTGRARQLLIDQFGPSDRPIVTQFAPGTVALAGEHTYYFNGFALLLSIPFGTAVAVRPTTPEESAVIHEEDRQEWDLNPPVLTDAPLWARIVHACLSHYRRPRIGAQVAIVSTIPESCADGRAAALAVATLRGLAAAHDLEFEIKALVSQATRIVASKLSRPYGTAPVLGAYFAEPERALAVDTATLEYVPLSLPSRERMAWALVVAGESCSPRVGVFQRRKLGVSDALDRLRHNGFPRLASLRSLDHQDLQAALDVLPRRLKAPTRHLVTENRRVQQLITALRRADSQLLGALMLMSQASLEKDWQEKDERVSFVMQHGEDQESLYGARQVGREFGRTVLFAGQPLAVSRLADRLTNAFADRFGTRPDILLF